MTGNRVKIADVSDFAENGSRIIREIDGIEIAVFRLEDEYYAVANFCPHQAGPLCEGQLLGDLRGSGDGYSFTYDKQERVISCPWHGWQFDITSGESLQSDQYSVPTYEVTVEGEEIYIDR